MHGSSFNYTNGMQLSIFSYTGHGMPSFCNNTAGTQIIFTSKEQLKQRYRICKLKSLLTKMCKNQIIQKKKFASCCFVEKQLGSREYVNFNLNFYNKLLNILDQRVVAPILFQGLPCVFH